jgi:hypothetical protein
MKVGGRAERTTTVLKAFIAKLTFIKLAVVESVMFGGSTALRARHILFGDFAMNAFKSMA